MSATCSGTSTNYACNKRGCQNIGGFNRTRYDACAYDRQLTESTSPLQYRLYDGFPEHCKKCIYDKFYYSYDLVDVESELKNITRGYTKCPQFKYSPTCKKSPGCFSTFDPSVPVSPPAKVCPVVYNNIPTMTTPGYTVPETNLCKK